MSTNLMNGPIWNMVKASLPKGASDAEIWKKTDKVLKENNMSWDSARKDQTVDGKSAPRKEIYQDLLGKKQEKKDTETKSPQKPTNDVKSTGPSDMVGTYQVPYYNNTGYQPSTGLNYNTWGNNYNYYPQQSSTPYTGFNGYLSGQGANVYNPGQLASRTGNYVHNMTGRQFLPWYNNAEALNFIM